MDARILRLGGIEAMNEIKSSARNTSVILNTAYLIHQEDFFTWPASAYVVKSSDMSLLKQKVEEALLLN